MDIENIVALHSLIHLIFHRNKNQHGGTKWWKWISILKRCLIRLLELLENGRDEPHTVRLYRQHLALRVIPQCYLAFSTVVADGQFSTLGTVLLAALARLTRATGIDKELKSSNRTHFDMRPSPCINDVPLEDVGEIVSRPKEPPVSAPRLNVKSGKENDFPGLHRQVDDVEKKADTVPKRLGKRKKGKKKNAIDDIFDGWL